ncbi:5350_t:CDS:2, partial [Cetraspora pellucida]
MSSTSNKRTKTETNRASNKAFDLLTKEKKLTKNSLEFISQNTDPLGQDSLANAVTDATSNNITKETSNSGLTENSDSSEVEKNNNIKEVTFTT